MNKTFRILCGFSCSGNRKPKNCTELSRRIESLKWLGVVGILVLTLGCVGMAQAQQSAKIPRIGYLNASSPSTNPDRVEAFLQGLRELGYVEGKNINIEYRAAEGKLDRLPALVAELVRLKVDVIVTAGPPGTRAAKEANVTIPIIMGFDNDPVGNGFVASLARPGGNITGLSTLAPEISGKQLDLLKEIVPGALSRGRPRDFDSTGHRTIVKRSGARRRGVQGTSSIPRRIRSQGHCDRIPSRNQGAC